MAVVIALGDEERKKLAVDALLEAPLRIELADRLFVQRLGLQQGSILEQAADRRASAISAGRTAVAASASRRERSASLDASG